MLTTRLKSIEMHSGRPSSPKRIFTIGLSLMNISGRNTTTVVSVESTTASATSPVPLITASRLLAPPARRRVMFSITTIASSTSMPSASVKPVMVSTLKLPPRK